jgi:hypothetical protein
MERILFETLAGRIRFERTGTGIRVEIPTRKDWSAILAVSAIEFWALRGLTIVSGRLFAGNQTNTTQWTALLGFATVAALGVVWLMWSCLGKSRLDLDPVEFKIVRQIPGYQARYAQYFAPAKCATCATCPTLNSEYSKASFPACSALRRTPRRTASVPEADRCPGPSHRPIAASRAAISAVQLPSGARQPSCPLPPPAYSCAPPSPVPAGPAPGTTASCATLASTARISGQTGRPSTIFALHRPHVRLHRAPRCLAGRSTSPAWCRCRACRYRPRCPACSGAAGGCARPCR